MAWVPSVNALRELYEMTVDNNIADNRNNIQLWHFLIWPWFIQSNYLLKIRISDENSSILAH